MGPINQAACFSPYLAELKAAFISAGFPTIRGIKAAREVNPLLVYTTSRFYLEIALTAFH